MPNPSQNQIHFKRVFHPSDFSKGDEKAFLHALRIALAAKGQISLLHVEPLKTKIEWNEFPRITPILSQWGTKGDSSYELNENRSQIKIQKIRKAGKEPKAILKHLESHPADLVVLATHQRGGLARLLHSAIAEPIARESGKMTLFVPRRVSGFVSSKNGTISLKHVLIPIDRRPHPQQAVDLTLQLLQLLKCENVSITFLHMNSDQENMPSINLPKTPDFNFEFMFEKGSIVEGILKVAEKTKADLIVMATQGHQGFLDALRGSTTEQVLRKAKCPVFAIPEY